ncbi:MAG: phosphoribosylanthranilate isomerase [Cyclobacteriaceae bacterium]
MKLKVCGMRESKNIEQLEQLSPDWMGLIFYPDSKRFVGDWDIKTRLKKVGVFVNEATDRIQSTIRNYGLSVVQLHGGESVDQVREVKSMGVDVWKVFGVMDELPIVQMDLYEGEVDAFLFDTKTRDHGGSGEQFDWSILSDYSFDTPFLLSGGLDLDDVEKIKAMDLEQLIGIDVNSRFEIEPGLKNIEKIRELKKRL